VRRRQGFMRANDRKNYQQTYSRLRCGKCACWTTLWTWRICAYRPQIGWRNFPVIGQGNTASGSTTSGVSVSSGGMGTPMRSRLRIIT